MTFLPIRFRLALRRFPLLHRLLRFVQNNLLLSFHSAFCEFFRQLLPRSTSFGLPSGAFSALEQVERQETDGSIILRDQGAPRIPNPSIMVLCRRQQHLEQPWPIFWSRHRQARLVGPSLVHVDSHKRISQEAAYGPNFMRTDPAFCHFVVGGPLHLMGPWTSIISRWSSNDRPQPFAHWLLDALPRLALLHDFPKNTQILVPPHQLPYQVESLKLLGLWDRCRPTAERHLLVEDYFFSAPTSMIVCYNPYAVNFMRSAFLPLAHGSTPTPARFFVRRTGTSRNIVNQEEVFAFFEKMGWSIVDPAKLTFAEQILWFSRAEAVCGIHGSGLANTMWCSPGCRVLELFAESYLGGDQEWICQCVGAEYNFSVFPADHKQNAKIDLSVLRSALKAAVAV